MDLATLAMQLLGDIFIWMVSLSRAEVATDTGEIIQVYFIRTRFNRFLNGKSYVNDVGNNSYNSANRKHCENIPEAKANTNKTGTLMFLLNEHWTFRSA